MDKKTPVKNIFIEGIQGSGKSTLLNRIAGEYPGLHVFREGDYSPADLAWCTWMNRDEYKGVLNRYPSLRNEIIKNTVQEGARFIITYTRILTDIPGFHKDLERYEIYNGRKTLAELKDIIFTRYSAFSETGCLFECAFSQNIVEDLILFQQLSDNEIMDFYRDLYDRISDKDAFLLIYLHSSDLENNISAIRRERCDDQGNEMWYPLMMEYLRHSPYGKEHACSTFSDLNAHLTHRQDLELRIIREIVRDKALILPAKNVEIERVREAIEG